MTEDPTAPKPAMTVALAQKPPVDTRQKLSVLPSKMVALLHKALLEQKHDEASQRHAFEEGQQDLQQQQKEAVTKTKVHTDHQVEDPNMELARYIEKEEKKRKLTLPSSKSVKQHTASAAAVGGSAHAKPHGLAKVHNHGTRKAHAAPTPDQHPVLVHDPASAEVPDHCTCVRVRMAHPDRSALGSTPPRASAWGRLPYDATLLFDPAHHARPAPSACLSIFALPFPAGPPARPIAWRSALLTDRSARSPARLLSRVCRRRR
jgi:hypothetical protein